MCDKNKFRAFSFVELSATLVIIGIGIASIVQTNHMLTDMKVNSAANLTKSSPVGSIKGLSLWLETTTQDSFREDEMENDKSITTWKDRNPQATRPYYALTAANAAITYKVSSNINDLASIYFDGSDSTAKLTLSKTQSLSSAVPIITPDNDFTAFIVSKLDKDAPSSVTAFSNGYTQGWGYQMQGVSGSRKRSTIYQSVGIIETINSDGSENPEITTITYSGNSGKDTVMRVNAQQLNTPATAIDTLIPNSAMYIGNSFSGSPWKGYISEIIIYERVLNNEEINKVESYLSKKYKIHLN